MRPVQRYVGDAAAKDLEDAAAASRLGNVKGGQGKYYVEKGCVRVLGPWPEVVGLDGNLIVAANGHPLGMGQKWHLPEQLKTKACKRFCAWVHGAFSCKCQLCTALPPRMTCPASLYVECTVACALCRGADLIVPNG